MNQFQAIVLLAAGMCCFATGVFGVDGANGGNKARNSAKAPHSAPAPKQEKSTSPRKNSIDSHPGERALERLERMKPDEPKGPLRLRIKHRIRMRYRDDGCGRLKEPYSRLRGGIRLECGPGGGRGGPQLPMPGRLCDGNRDINASGSGS